MTEMPDGHAPFGRAPDAVEQIARATRFIAERHAYRRFPLVKNVLRHFEIQPKSEQWDAYLGYAEFLRPEPTRLNGFIDNVRYRLKRRPGVVLSLSTWRDEKALVRWRTHALHHEVQEKGRSGIFQNFRPRVGVTAYVITHRTRRSPRCLACPFKRTAW